MSPGVVPRTAYIICASPRSGSNLLCETLWSTNELGRPDEYFLRWHGDQRDYTGAGAEAARAWALSDDAYLQKVVEEGTTPNGVFGVKMMWGYFDDVVRRLAVVAGVAPEPAGAVLNAIWPKVRFLHMVRRDKVAQAVSLAKAIQSGRWLDVDRSILSVGARHFFSKDLHKLEAYLDQPPPASPEYDFDEIERRYRDVLREDAAWERFLDTAEDAVFSLVYERFVDREGETVEKIRRFLGEPVPAGATLPGRFMKRQGDAINREWAERFCDDLTARGEEPRRT